MKKKINKIIFICACFVCAASLILGIYYFSMMNKSRSNYNDLRSNAVSTLSGVASGNDEMSIDFEELQNRNSDIYAWITIPDTQIDYPIVQSYSEDDSFYLNHNIDKQYDQNGSIYTEKHNTKDFSDPNTVIYGHNMLDGSMFQNLHKFRDKEFFDEHKYIYIYTPDRILEYTVVSAYKSDDRHILNSYDLNDEEVFADYLKTVENPQSLEVNRRDIELSVSDRLITLSTCIGNEKNYRYLVQGVLTNESTVK